VDTASAALRSASSVRLRRVMSVAMPQIAYGSPRELIRGNLIAS
jgi:hypothetical protein